MNWSMSKLSVTERNDKKTRIRNIHGNNLGKVTMNLGPKLNEVECWMA
jgi:hypothetical protein